MNNDFIYVLVESGEYEDQYNFFIKIKEVDRLKFKDFARHTKGFGWQDAITIRAWIKELYLEADEYFDVMEVLTINEYKEILKEVLERMDTMGNRHYLKGKEEYFIKLLNYEFHNIEAI